MHSATAEERRIFERALGLEQLEEPGAVDRYVRAWRLLFPLDYGHTDARLVRARPSDDLFDRTIRSAVSREPRRWKRRSRTELARRLEAPRTGGYRSSGRAPTLRARYEPSWLAHAWLRLKTFDRIATQVVVARRAWVSGGEVWVEAGGAIWSAALRKVRVAGIRQPGAVVAPHPLEDFEWLGLSVDAGACYVVPGDCELAEALRRHTPGYFT